MFTSQVALFAAGAVKKTPLYDFHVAHQGNVVPFCGWYLPTVYKGANISESHLYTRSCATIFDVSHMGQLKIHGKDRYDFIESLVPGDIKGLEENQARLTQFTNEKGGIIDDTIITKKDGYLFEIINAGTSEADLVYLGAKLAEWKARGKDVDIEHHLETANALVALQGPKAWRFLQEMINKTNPESERFLLKKQSFMTSHQMTIAGMELRVSRLGYTGEDGFEIQVPAEKAIEFTEQLIDIALPKTGEKIMLAGLGPRDTLRLESGLCLMGQDMTAETTPIEAALAWTISKRRRQEANFPGSKKILEQIKKGVSKKRMGWIMEGKVTARTHHKIYADKGKKKLVGEVTSGSFGPSIQKCCGMCYINDMKLVKAFEKEGKEVNLYVDIRNKMYPLQLAKMPFVKGEYYRAK